MVSPTTNGYTGSVKTLSLNVKTVKFVPAEATMKMDPPIVCWAAD